jgi:quercetin dioxygenase-like cupin family protein
MDEVLFEQSLNLALPMRSGSASSAVWNPHPSFKGVHLMHIITGEDTDGRLSLHLVKVEPGCSLEEHRHEDQLELHEVLQGQGECRVEGRHVAYVPGALAVIPKGSRHDVVAGENGLHIKAVFTPALL